MTDPYVCHMTGVTWPPSTKTPLTCGRINLPLTYGSYMGRGAPPCNHCIAATRSLQRSHDQRHATAAAGHRQRHRAADDRGREALEHVHVPRRGNDLRSQKKVVPPGEIAKLVNISPISLWVLLVIYRTS